MRRHLLLALLCLVPLLAASCDWLEDLPRAWPGTPTGQAGEAEPGREVEAEPGQAAQARPSASERTLHGPMLGVFEYTDRQGVVHFVDDIEKVPPEYRKKVRHPDGGAVTILPSTPIDDLLDQRKIDPRQYARKAEPARPAAGRRHDQVILYYTSWCPYCVRAKAHLEQRKVRFALKDVERDEAALREMLEKSGGSRGVPVLDVYGTVLRGFSPAKIDQALKR
jgi:glutaredoxin-like YruB-family protein